MINNHHISHRHIEAEIVIMSYFYKININENGAVPQSYHDNYNNLVPLANRYNRLCEQYLLLDKLDLFTKYKLFVSMVSIRRNIFHILGSDANVPWPWNLS